MPKRFPLIITILLVATIVAGTYAFWLREPSYEGKSLTYWVWKMEWGTSGPEKEKARIAVHQLANHSPKLLLRWIREENQAKLGFKWEDFRQKAMDWLTRHNLMGNRSSHIASNSPRYPGHSATAQIAMTQLDPPQKSAAISKLIAMLSERGKKPNDISFAAGAAYCALPRLVPESIPPLIQALTNEDFLTLGLVCGALANIGPPAKAAVPALREKLKDTDPKARLLAANAESMIGGDPNDFLPMILQDLRKADDESFDYELQILANIKEAAKPAVPILREMLAQTTDSAKLLDKKRNVEIQIVLRVISPDPLGTPATVSNGGNLVK